ncbi:sulfatase [uncultured Algibacter sp.]|uniref:sulfatase n=1 Tax=uncultured Algibacter sp. TaxID=298659 RepID=UPI003216EF64
MNKFLSIISILTLSISLIGCKGQVTKEEAKLEKSDKPNIVLLFVDDWGWGDLGYRNSIFETPNIDKLKSESLDFNRAYIPTPTCSPSRASILTGKEAVRMGFVRHISENEEKEFNLWPKDPVQMPSRNWLPLSEVTYAEKLKDLGYYNMFVGKWHLGEQAHYPDQQGFDGVYGTTDAGHPKSYYYPFFKTKEDPKQFLKSGIKEGDYLTNVLTDKATDFIKTYDKKDPFMLSFWYYTVHGPFVGRKDLLKKYKEKGLDKKYAHYAAMVEALDESVGRIRASVEEKGIADNTVIILISDQGGAFTNAPLSGGKKGGNTLGEGGARVPFMVLYPGVTKANTSTDIPVQSIDLFPTLIEIASGKPYQDNTIQGKSLMPILKGGDIDKRNLFFFRSYEDQYAAVIDGDWKLIKYHSGLYKLFNVVKDVSETNNLIDTETKKAEALKGALSNWEKEAVPVY